MRIGARAYLVPVIAEAGGIRDLDAIELAFLWLEHKELEHGSEGAHERQAEEILRVVVAVVRDNFLRVFCVGARADKNPRTVCSYLEYGPAPIRKLLLVARRHLREHGQKVPIRALDCPASAE